MNIFLDLTRKKCPNFVGEMDKSTYFKTSKERNYTIKHASGFLNFSIFMNISEYFGFLDFLGFSAFSAFSRALSLSLSAIGYP